ncbi:hypothetical protein SDC9_78832 [bioreactor metagenome]|uniref:Uncharacterized protein n=1 Tax=bioreactor metagenome TaxID=1076179 RepID=A0A644YUJ6_9ZZZZ
MVLRQILHLNQSASPAPGTICAVKLKHSACASVGADRVFHSLIFLDGGFGKLLTEHKNITQFRRSGFQKLYNGFFTERIRFHTVISKPLLHLYDRVGIIQFGELLHLGC